MLPLAVSLALACGPLPEAGRDDPGRQREAMVKDQVEARGVRDARTLAARMKAR